MQFLECTIQGGGEEAWGWGDYVMNGWEEGGGVVMLWMGQPIWVCACGSLDIP